MPALGPVADVAALVRTREAWHMVAEHVLAPARFRATGRLSLQVVPGGFGTPPFDDQGETTELRVVGRKLTVVRGGHTSTISLTTVRRAGEAAGIAPGAAPEVYPLSTVLDPDAPLAIDDDAAALLAAWFEIAWSALDELRRGAHADDAPSNVALWPEHFDAAVDVGDETRGQRGTFGASPGDDEHPEPYLYVTHWAALADDPFWNDASFAGASLGCGELAGVADPVSAAIEFYDRGRALLRSSSA